jgi:LCP family protein required for cell wall assembly
LLIPAILILVVAGWFGYKAVQAAHRIIGAAGSGAPALDGAIDLTKLKGEGDGRINILVMGVGGAGHDGPDLSDTMMVWSIDPKTKDVAMLSVPRDLYVKIPSSIRNRAQFGKINAANALGGPDVAAKAVESVIGVPIHYFVVVDFSGFKQAIDAVGGVDINVKQALFDKTYPCETGNKYCPYVQPAGLIHMSGLQALRYSRCRHNDPGIGNCGNDYGRAARQQEVITALRQKALSAGTLTNPIKLNGLINAIGGHVKTDLQLGELNKLAAMAKDINPAKVVNKVLDDAPDSFLVGGTNIIPAAGYIYVPKAGIAVANYFDYSDIQDFIKNIFVDHYITDENARLEIQNGSGIIGLATRITQSLKSAHYNVMSPVNAPNITTKTVIYDYTNGKKPYTINYLEERFGVKAVKTTLPPTVSSSPVATTAGNTSASLADVVVPEIRIILGSDYQSTTQSSPTPVR